jgi:hypothetical protein
LAWLFPLTSVTTTLLVSRFLWLVWPGTWNERAVPELSRWMGQISCTLENDMAAGLQLVLLAVAFMLLGLG